MRQRVRGRLVRDIPVRLLDFSLSGCLVATNHLIHSGTIGELQVTFHEHEYRDTMIVVRTIQHHGFSYAHTAGGQFAWGNRPGAASLRGSVPSILRSPTSSSRPTQ